MLGVLARHPSVRLQFLTPALALKDIRHRKGKIDWESLWRLGDEKVRSRWDEDKKGLHEIHSGTRRLFDLRPVRAEAKHAALSSRLQSAHPQSCGRTRWELTRTSSGHIMTMGKPDREGWDSDATNRQTIKAKVRAAQRTDKCNNSEFKKSLHRRTINESKETAYKTGDSLCQSFLHRRAISRMYKELRTKNKRMMNAASKQNNGTDTLQVTYGWIMDAWKDVQHPQPPWKSKSKLHCNFIFPPHNIFWLGFFPLCSSQFLPNSLPPGSTSFLSVEDK